MKRTLLALAAALCILPAHDLLAQGRHENREPRVEISDLDRDSPGRVGPRRDLDDARYAITTTNDVASLLLTRDVVALQLTDRQLRQIRGEIEEDAANEREDGLLARMIANVVRSTVGSMLRKSIEISVDDLRSVEYRGGRLEFTTTEGERVFEQVEIDDTEVMEHFSPADAQAFVREFRAVKTARSR